jgi:hypothetical protein
VGRLFLPQPKLQLDHNFGYKLPSLGQFEPLTGCRLIGSTVVAMTARSCVSGETPEGPDLIVTTFTGALPQGSLHAYAKKDKEANPDSSKKCFDHT